jgi:hypothetical protein
MIGHPADFTNLVHKGVARKPRFILVMDIKEFIAEKLLVTEHPEGNR